MSNDRRLRLWTQIVEHAGDAAVTIDHVCAVAMTATNVDAAAVTVLLDGGPGETVYSSGQLATAMEDMSLTLGEGPATEVAAEGPSLVADVTAAECQERWPVFAASAVRTGVRAHFALPLSLGGIVRGVLCLYRAQPGELNRDQLADGLVLADTITGLLLDAEQRPTPSLHDSRWSDGIGPQQPAVHQATGMLTVQLGVTAAVALVRLRAYAFSRGRRLGDVAADVVARRLRLDESEE